MHANSQFWTGLKVLCFLYLPPYCPDEQLDILKMVLLGSAKLWKSEFRSLLQGGRFTAKKGTIGPRSTVYFGRLFNAAFLKDFGGASRDRTDDLIVANDEFCHRHLVDSINSLRNFYHFQHLFIGPVMGQNLGQSFLRTP